MNHYDPVWTDATGRRELASWYYPEIGPYDSMDPLVMEYQVLLMKLAGIDGVIVDWYGVDDFVDYPGIEERTRAMLGWVERAGLTFCLCYEDRTIAAEIEFGHISAAEGILHAQMAMSHAEEVYFSSPSYQRLDGKPVLLNFGPVYFLSSRDWNQILSVLSTTNQPAFFTLHQRLLPAMGAFSWPPMWLAPSDGEMTVATLESYLNSLEQTAASAPWPAFISSAFPRFHDIYAEAGVSESYGRISDREGATFRETLARGMTNASAMVQLVTWNDYGEGTQVEPTREFGHRDLEAVQELRRLHLDAGFVGEGRDLELPGRLLAQRRKHGDDLVLSGEMDRVFENIVNGDLALAGRRLDALELGLPVVVKLTLDGVNARVEAGGFLSGSQLRMESANSLSDGVGWQLVDATAPGPGRVYFTDSLTAGSRTRYYRLSLVP